MIPDTCEICGDDHCDRILDPACELVCLACTESGEAALCEYTGMWRKIMKCCGCDNYGPINYGRHDREYHYYCGTSPRCTP